MKLVILVGLPASGKTTMAMELVAQGYTRVNRDSLRVMMHNGKYTPANEELIKDVESLIIQAALEAGESVVVDDTNLAPGIVDRWRRIGYVKDAEVEVVRLEVSIEECIRRDALREAPVGEAVIRRLAAQ